MTVKPKPQARIIQRGRNHSYELDFEKVPGVTTVLNGGFPKPALVYWAAKACAQEVLDYWDDLAALSPSQRYEQVRTAPDRDRDAAARRGTEVHDYAQRYLAGETITPPDEIAGHVDAYIKFVEEWKPVEVAVEAACFNREFRYAGRFDMLARLADGHLWLLDLKTTRSGVFIDNVLQLAGYKYAEFYVLPGELNDNGQAVEHPMPQVDRCGVVWLRGDGTYELYALDANDEAFTLFGYAQGIAVFAKSEQGNWISDPLRPPETA
jgi:hypothetical protein